VFLCAKTAQKHAFDPIMTLLWVILCKPSRKKGQFHGCTHQLIAQFHGICLKESQPRKRTFAERAALLERTFGRVSAPEKRTFPLIYKGFPGSPQNCNFARTQKRVLEHFAVVGR
jgi:hypothetical protein